MKDSGRIKYLIMDVDGTLTDGKIYMGQEGELFKAFSACDGYGIRWMLPPAGITPVIITGRRSAIVENRCAEIGIKKIFQEVNDKGPALEQYIAGEGDSLSAAAYIGDDLNDLPCIKLVRENGGITGCPKDAVEEVKNNVDFVSSYKGGEGAVREFIEWLLNAR